MNVRVKRRELLAHVKKASAEGKYVSLRLGAAPTELMDMLEGQGVGDGALDNEVELSFEDYRRWVLFRG